MKANKELQMLDDMKEEVEKSTKRSKFKSVSIFALLVIIVCLVVTLVLTYENKEINNVSVKDTGFVISDHKDDTEYEVLRNAVEFLKTENEYVVTTYLSDPASYQGFIEVYDNGASYTKIPDGVTTDSSLAWQQRTEDSVYYLSDYITADNKMYLCETSDGTSYEFYSVPKTYAEKCRTRDVMFLDKILESCSDVEYIETTVFDIGDGEETMDVYELTIPSDTVRALYSLGSYDLYDSIRMGYPNNLGLIKLMTWYLEDLSPCLTYSDGKVTVAVCDNVPRYLNIEVGGLGSRAYITKCISFASFDEAKIEKPDFSNAVEYVTLYEEFADVCKDYDTMEEAIDAMYQNYSSDLDLGNIDEETTIEEGTISKEELPVEEETSTEATTEE